MIGRKRAWLTVFTNPAFHVAIIIGLGLLLRLAFLTRVPVFLLRDSGGVPPPRSGLAISPGFDIPAPRTPGSSGFHCSLMGVGSQGLAVHLVTASAVRTGRGVP